MHEHPREEQERKESRLEHFAHVTSYCALLLGKVLGRLPVLKVMWTIGKR